MDKKTWTKLAIILWLFILSVTGLVVIIVDPYHHYHKPLSCFTYSSADAVYVNDGKCKNFDYDAIITGTSMTSGFSEKEASDLFQMTFLRATFLGEGFKRINENLETAIEHNPDLRLVIRSVDPLWFITDLNWMAYDNYPLYLYNDSIMDDVKYLYNIDIWMDSMIPTLITYKKSGREPRETYTQLEHNQKEYLEKEIALDNYERPIKENNDIDAADFEEYLSCIDQNLDVNLLNVIENHPDIEFYLYFPPYSILWWDSINQAGEGRVERRVYMEQYVIEKILKYDNVRLFSFTNNYDLICNLDNYSDEIHYHPDINSKILKWMKSGEYEITEDNYLRYISEISNYLVNYDYDAIFK